MKKGIKLVEHMQYPEIDMIRTGKWLRAICKYKQMPVVVLRDYLSLGSSQSVYGWFCGRTLPSLDNFYALSKLLCIPIDEVIINTKELLPKSFLERVGIHNVRLMSYWLKMEW